jgi:tRNA(Ile)-lysidine synthase
LVAAHASRPSPGLVRLDPAFAHAEDKAAGVHLLRVLLAVTGGTTFLPPKEAAEALLARLATGAARATLSRCVADARRAGIFLHREERGLPTARIAAGGVWDGRHRITFGDGGHDLVIAPRGKKSPEPDVVSKGAAPPSLARAAFAAEPAVPHGTERPLAADNGEKPGFEPVMAPWRLFLPCFDLAVARAVSALVGARPVPGPPFSGPNGVEPWSNA